MTDLNTPPFDAGDLTNISTLGNADDGRTVTVSGTLSKTATHTTVQGRPWSSAFLTDDTDWCELILFPDAHADFGHLIADDIRVAVTARVQACDVEAHGQVWPQPLTLAAVRVFPLEETR